MQNNKTNNIRPPSSSQKSGAARCGDDIRSVVFDGNAMRQRRSSTVISLPSHSLDSPGLLS
jgi:hypothetical protein